MDLPMQRHPQEILSCALDLTVLDLSARGGVAVLWGGWSLELQKGEWPSEGTVWLQRWRKDFQEELEIGEKAYHSPDGGIHCYGAPLGEKGNIFGLMAMCLAQPVSSAKKGRFSLVARGVGAALHNIQELEGAKKHADQLRLLYDVGIAMNSILVLRDLLDEVMRRGQVALGAEACSVLLVDEEKKELYFEVAKGEAGKVLEQVRMGMDQGIAGWIATHGRSLVVNDVTQYPQFYKKIDDSVGFVTRSILGVPLFARGRTIGVIEVLNKKDLADFTQEDLELLTALSADVAIAIDNARLYQAVLDGYLDTIKALAASIDAKDPYTAGHVDRVSSYSMEMAEVLSLSTEEQDVLRYGSILHDVGKMGIDDRILRKPGPLTSEEWAIMCTHTEIGSRIVQDIPFLRKALPIIRHHHENFDGTGYPDRLAGADIPLGARIVQVADTFDAMTTDRPYRRALTTEEADNELRKKAGTQFDPVVVDAFAEALLRKGVIATG
ncbi:MAG: GAF domain-containing protein [Chloroflexi bacterium]|nr:GAF domain-containing protein [Chloroflexota bacterium]